MPTAKKTASKPKAAPKKAAPSDSPESHTIAARPALRSDPSGQGRTLDALGNPRS